MRKGIGPRGLGAAKSPLKQVRTDGQRTIGGKPMREIDSAADVPRSTSYGGTNYNLGGQSGTGSHYYAEGYDSKHEKKGTIKRPGDEGVYHVSRANVKTTQLKPKKPQIIKD